jgi:predicted nucleic acid-binding protein
VYVETDFLLALAKPDDWLQDAAREALEKHDDIHTSINAYTELLLYAYDSETGEYTIDVERALTNLVERVPVQPAVHEEAVLVAAVLASEDDFTPFDAIHAGIAIASGETILSSEQDYDKIDIDRLQLESRDE